MKNATLLWSVRYYLRLYERLSAVVCEQHQITQTELDILAFLHHHPGQDTARDIVNLRMLPKANVSVAVESMIQKGLLHRQPDQSDRRRIHLLLSTRAHTILPDILNSRNEIERVMLQGFTPEECAQYETMNQRAAQNMKEYMDNHAGKQ